MPRRQRSGAGQHGLSNVPAAELKELHAEDGPRVRRTKEDMQAKAILWPRLRCRNLVREFCGCKSQLRPSCTQKKKKSRRSVLGRHAGNGRRQALPLHLCTGRCSAAGRVKEKKDKKKINWSYSRWFVTHALHRFFFFFPLVRLFWGVASWICAVRGCTWGRFAAGKYESGSGVPEHPLPAPEPPHLPTAPSKTLVRGGSLGPGEPLALSCALLGICKSRHPKSLDIVKKCPNQGANSPLGKCSSSDISQPPPWAQGNTSGGNSRKPSCKSSSAGAWSCTASATPYLALLL